METLSKESPQFKRCMDLLPLVLDKQANVDDTNFFHQYAKNWPEIQTCFEQETAFRMAIRQKLGSLPAPKELLSNVRASIKQPS